MLSTINLSECSSHICLNIFGNFDTQFKQIQMLCPFLLSNLTSVLFGLLIVNPIIFCILYSQMEQYCELPLHLVNAICFPARILFIHHTPISLPLEFLLSLMLDYQTYNIPTSPSHNKNA